METTQVLVIEDEQDIRDLISFQLKSEGLGVTAVESADRAISYLGNGKPFDLILVDWMLPGSMNGHDLIKRLRSLSEYKETPIIMVTALTQPENIVAGLDAGADDYITKPFDLNVLQARVRVQLRARPSEQKSDFIKHDILKIETAKCRVFVEGDEVSLTSTEYKILLMLAEKPGHVFTRDQFINNIQGENVFVTGRTIDTHMAGLRKKIGPAANMIETIRGIGYRFKDVL